ncbi:MAG TPA: ATPase, T2SS/T4P/T4SS family, partial [Candidatus Tumulicola sp.]|nr:ATPase, T2SS/T4P/T4SS family [Candidatus Tumulicola sp.]
YAAITERNVVAQQICSIEDPIEIRIPGTAQMQVNVRAGLTFAVGLRSFLRQDPNVIAVGEMRDPETAAVAASAALCGQLVLTTLHSGNALGAFERLRELGMTSRRIGNAVTAIASQRLLRRLCAECRVPAAAGAEAVRFGVARGSPANVARGCEACAGSGYRGRMGVFEIVAMSSELRHAIETEAAPGELRDAALRGGYLPMARAAGQLVTTGESSVEEASRVLSAGLA